MSDKSTIQLVAEHLILALQPLRNAFTDLNEFRAFMWGLGWNLQTAQSIPPAYTSLADLVKHATASLETLQASPDASEVAALLKEVRDIYEAVQTLDELPKDLPSTFLDELKERLFELLLVEYLAAAFPAAFNVLQALGVIVFEFYPEPEDGSRPAYRIARFKAEEIPNIINNPETIPGDVYGWGTSDFNFPLLAHHLHEALTALDRPAAIDFVDPTLAEKFQASAETVSKPIEVQVTIPVAEIAGTLSVELALLEFPAEDNKPPGVILQPLVPSGISTEYVIRDGLKLLVEGATDLGKTFGIVFRPGELSVRYPFQPGTPPPKIAVGLALEYKPKTATVLLGQAQSSRLQCAGVSLGFNLGYLDDKLELSFEAVVHDLAIVLALSEQDGFIAKLFSGANVTVPIPLALRWSNIDGLSFVGSANFVVSSYPHLAIGPVTIEAVQLAARASLEKGEPPQFALEAGVSFKGQLGIVSFTVEEVGVSLGCWFVSAKTGQSVITSGNAGPFNVEVGYKAPKGAGLKLSGAAVTGGGYLNFDDEKKQYAGIVSLVVEDFLTLTAIGLLTTRMPDGSDGFSLLLIITAEGFTPIQLGFGFTLQGVGGLLGVNRTVAVDEIRAGLKGHVLDAILFPKNPVENATQYVSDLQHLFPPTEGRHVFGPMVIIGWGTPTILTLELAVLLDLPSPLRLIAVGRVRALLPSAEAALVKLQMDAVGVIDFDLAEGSLDATLVDSTIAGFAVTGDMALRASWAENPGFLLAIGGFHPHFQPPPDFPALERLAVNLADSAALRLRLEVYLALTSNTAQFGAHLDLYAEAAGFSVKGDFSFDTLFNFSPFEFRADVGGAVALAYKGESLMSVRFSAGLSGPAPWRANGSATFEYLGLTQIINLLLELGSVPSLPALPKINLKERLREVLNDTRSWRGQLPADKSALVSFRASELTTEALVHPLGDLALQQNVLPLKVDIERFGNSTVEGDRYFQIAGLKSESANGSTTGGGISFEGTVVSALSDYFAPAHYFELDDAEQLSRPSFETMEAGLGFVAEALALPGVSNSGDEYENVSQEITYETVIIDPNGPKKRSRSDPRSMLSSEFTRMASYSAAAQSRARSSGKAKYRAPTDQSVSVSDTTYVIATIADLTFVAIGGIDPATGVAYAEADDALTHYLLTHPEAAGLYQIAGIHEAKVY